MNPERLLKVLLGPHVSEKSTVLAEMQDQYTFKVAKDATKQEVKSAVESLFKVKVQSVQILNQKGKVKRFGQSFGRRTDWKKAYVRIAEGQAIRFDNPVSE